MSPKRIESDLRSSACRCLEARLRREIGLPATTRCAGIAGRRHERRIPHRDPPDAGNPRPHPTRTPGGGFRVRGRPTPRRFAVAGLVRNFWSNAGPIRAIFREAFAAAGLPYLNPHSIRKTLAQLGERICNGPEEFEAWSQTLGHDHVATTFSSYGQGPVPSAMRDPAGVRQAEGGARCACGRLRRLSLGAGFQGPCIAFGLKSITSPPVRRVSRWSVKRLSLGSCASRRAVTDQSPRRNDVRSRQAERTAERNPRTVRLRFSACLVSSFDVPYT